MYETIYIEKNKSTRFGVHFYENSSQWNVFKDVCGIQEEKLAFIYNADIKNDAWKTIVKSASAENVLELSEKAADNGKKLCDFLQNKKKHYTFVLLCDSYVMSEMYHNVTAEDAKISFIAVPITPFAMFDGVVTIRPELDENGEILRKELLPKAVYADVSVLKEATPLEFQDGIASAFRLAISYKASMFEWMISNMYELTDGEEEAIVELLKRGYEIWKERIEKDTAKDRSLPVYGSYFYKLLEDANHELNEAELASLSMVCQTYLSWKKDLISMEEYYEIRDMFVFFGMAITETFATPKELVAIFKQNDYDITEEWVYIRKLGKLIKETAPTETLILEALEQIYYDEQAVY